MDGKEANDVVEVNLRLSPEPRAASVARHSLSSLAGVVDYATLEDVQLMISELVTNSLRHSGLDSQAHIEVRVKASLRGLRVEVRDPGPGFQARARQPGQDERSGWGLFLVERLANRWGVRRDRGTVVWFELDRPKRA
jgi:anti-sigma regulatory factor (Ser/Thr protein kinase)